MQFGRLGLVGLCIVCGGLGYGLGVYRPKAIPSRLFGSSGGSRDQPAASAVQLSAAGAEPSLERSGPLSRAALSREFAAILEEAVASRREARLRDYGAALSVVDPDSFAAALEKLTRGPDREAFLQGFVHLYAQAQPERCLQLVGDLPASIYKSATLEIALQRIAEVQPATAVAYLDSNLRGLEKYNSALKVSEAWAKNDPAGAFQWALTASPQVRDAVLEQVAATWGHDSPEAALAFLRDQSALSSTDRELSTRAVVATWSMNQPERAFAWAKDHLSSGGSAEPLAVGLMNIATFEPALAARLSGEVTLESVRAQVTPMLAGVWGETAPTAGAAWVAQLQAGETRTQAILGLVESWTHTDPEGARQWVRTLPASDPALELALQMVNAPAGPTAGGNYAPGMEAKASSRPARLGPSARGGTPAPPSE